MKEYTDTTSTSHTQSDWEDGYKRGKESKINDVKAFAGMIFLCGAMTGFILSSLLHLETWAFWFVVALYFLSGKIQKVSPTTNKER